MVIHVESLFQYVTFENQHPRLVGILRRYIYKYYIPDINTAIAMVIRLNQYLNYRSGGEDRFMLSTKVKNDSVQYKTNCGMSDLFFENENVINAIYADISRIGIAIRSFERDWAPELPLPVLGDMVSVDRYASGLRRQLDEFEEYRQNKKDLGDLTDKRVVRCSNRRYYKRMFEFDCGLMYDTLCDDVIGVIREFVGEEFLESVRRKTTSDKYFPVPRKRNLTAMLGTWRLGDLKWYSRHMFIKHEFPWDPRTKSSIIERIIHYRRGFFELHRDIVCVTKALGEKRVRERTLKRAVTKDRAAARALKPTVISQVPVIV